MERKDIRKERQGLPFFKSELDPMGIQPGIAFGRQYVDSKNPTDNLDPRTKTQNPRPTTPLETQNPIPETLNSKLMTPLVREHMQKDMERLRSTLQMDRIAEPAFQMMPRMKPAEESRLQTMGYRPSMSESQCDSDIRIAKRNSNIPNWESLQTTGYQTQLGMDPKMMAINADPRTGEADLKGLMPLSLPEKQLPYLVHERKLHGSRNREPAL